jgi:GH25 family lysozyme M1 (1,4-beta-N-acetylmuramidase)
MAQIKGLDVSKFQGEINYDQLKTQADFVIIRSSYGTGFIDGMYVRNRDEARRVGMGIGFYHYAYARLNSAEAEADYFCQVVSDLRQGELLVLDWEETYAGNHVDWCKRFLDRVATHFNGLKPLIYLNKGLQKGKDWSPVVNAGYGLWLADYENNGSASPWSMIAMQQTTSSGSIAGISGNVDLDIFYGTLNAFRKYGFNPPVVTPPAPAVDPKDQEISNLKTVVTAREATIASQAIDLSAKDTEIARLNGIVEDQDALRKACNSSVAQANQEKLNAVSEKDAEITSLHEEIDKLSNGVVTDEAKDKLITDLQAKVTKLQDIANTRDIKNFGTVDLLKEIINRIFKK